jgi:hypothetical protein
MPDFGIGEGLAALFGGGDILSLLGIGGGEAAAGGAGAGAGLADIVGTGAGLAGGTTGLEGTLLAGGAGGLEGGALGTVGLGAAGTAADFIGAPGASGFNAAATTPGAGFDIPGIGAPGGGPGTLEALTGGQPQAFGGVNTTNLPANVLNANAFDTSLAGTGVNAGSSPIANAGGAAGIAAPPGVNAPVDATSFVGNTSLNGAPLGGQPGVTPAAAAPSSPIADLLGKGGGAVTDAVSKNPLGTLLGAAGLGYNIYQGQKNTQNIDALKADAQVATANSNEEITSGRALQQYLTNGTLPPAYQTVVDNAIKDAKTNAISNAAQQGQNTDPTQNTALAAALAKIDASRATMQTQVATQLFSSGQGLVNSGAAAAGLSETLYQALVNNDTTQAANTGKAIATLAAALNGKSNNTIGGTNIQVSQAA